MLKKWLIALVPSSVIIRNQLLMGISSRTMLFVILRFSTFVCVCL